MGSFVKDYFADLYQYTMKRAYDAALMEIARSLDRGGLCLDCGADDGKQLQALRTHCLMDNSQYVGIEWHRQSAARAKEQGLQIICGDLNEGLPFAEGKFRCVFALSVLEHLLFGCRFLQETFRVLEPGGRLVVLTPNLSAWFNVVLLAIGRMPSSGPHPDSIFLMNQITPVRFRECNSTTIEQQQPVDRHIVVFTYRTLKSYLRSMGFKILVSRGYGLYPFPAQVQNLFEQADPWHCHQMFFVCKKIG